MKNLFRSISKQSNILKSKVKTILFSMQKFANLNKNLKNSKKKFIIALQTDEMNTKKALSQTMKDAMSGGSDRLPHLFLTKVATK